LELKRLSKELLAATKNCTANTSAVSTTCSSISDDKMQPVHTDTFYVSLTHTAISHFNVEAKL